MVFGIGFLDRIEFLNPLDSLQISRRYLREKAPDRWLDSALFRPLHPVPHLRVEAQEFRLALHQIHRHVDVFQDYASVLKEKPAIYKMASEACDRSQGHKIRSVPLAIIAVTNGAIPEIGTFPRRRTQLLSECHMGESTAIAALI
jgi:hypothetical protein